MAQLTLSQLQQTFCAALDASTVALGAEDRRALGEAAAMVLATELAPPLTEPQRRLDRDLLDSNLFFAVPDDALNLFPSLVQAALGAFTKGPIGALSDLVGLMMRYRTLHVPVSAEEAAVLRALKKAKAAGVPPLAVADLHARLAAEGLLPQRPLDELLMELQSRKTEKATLVREVEGRWAIGNV